MLLGAPSCVDEEEIARQEEEALEEVREGIRDEFEAEYLTEANLYAYETAAKQKLADLTDYIQVLTDTTKDFSFRQKAGEMIQNLFHSKNDKVELGLQKRSTEDLLIGDLIEKGLANKIPNLHFSIDSIQIHEPLRRTDNSTYTGILQFSQNFTEISTPEQPLKSISRNAEFFVIKEFKAFGTDTLWVWNVKLGDTR